MYASNVYSDMKYITKGQCVQYTLQKIIMELQNSCCH